MYFRSQEGVSRLVSTGSLPTKTVGTGKMFKTTLKYSLSTLAGDSTADQQSTTLFSLNDPKYVRF